MLEINPQISISGKSGSKVSISEQKQNLLTKITHCSEHLTFPQEQIQMSQKKKTKPKQKIIHDLRKKVDDMQKKQENIKSKYEMMVNVLEKELSKKQKLNQQIQSNISALTSEIEESKNDYDFLANYILHKKSSSIQSPQLKQQVKIKNRSTLFTVSPKAVKFPLKIDQNFPLEKKKSTQKNWKIISLK